MGKFKVGDIVVGNQFAEQYSITSPGTRWEVLSLNSLNKTMIVGWTDWERKKKLETGRKDHFGNPRLLLDDFPVDQRCFDLVRENLSEDELTKQIKKAYGK